MKAALTVIVVALTLFVVATAHAGFEKEFSAWQEERNAICVYGITQASLQKYGDLVKAVDGEMVQIDAAAPGTFGLAAYVKQMTLKPVPAGGVPSYVGAAGYDRYPYVQNASNFWRPRTPGEVAGTCR